MNADVLEVIAEYACTTVADACALRGSCKGYRRAVDTTVRRLVYEDQPELRLSLPRNGSPPATLHVHLNTEHLDAVRIAVTCDAFPRIARLVVVAFALDGAKDEAHEGGACGPRPVSSSKRAEHEGPAGDGFLDALSHASWYFDPMLQATGSTVTAPRPQVALVRCLADATVGENDLTAELCAAVESASRPWAGVRKLVLLARCGKPRTPDAVAARQKATAARLLRAVGSQLTHLAVNTFDREWCAILATCGNLVEVRIDDPDATPENTVSICDALIASGAKLQRVHGPNMEASRVVAMLEAIPTIVAVAIHTVTVEALPPAVAQRLEFFNYASTNDDLPRLRHLEQWAASDFATSVIARSLPVVDVETALPALRRLRLDTIEPGVDVDALRFPPALVELAGPADASSSAGVVRALGRQGPAHLCNLTELSLKLPGEGAGRCIEPLVGFARTLRELTLETAAAAWGAEDVACIVATVSRLVALTRAVIPQLPTARCFLLGSSGGGDGKHHHMRRRRLRTVSLESLGDVPFAALVEACPPLMCVITKQQHGQRAHSPVDGWVVSTSFGTVSRRVSGTTP